jgi:hypothetical protein
MRNPAAPIPYPLYTQHDLDSGALTMKCVVAHPMVERGAYRGTLAIGDDPRATFLVEVSSPEDSPQAMIDAHELQLLARHAPPDGIAKRVRVRQGGFVVLHVSAGEGGHHVTFQGADSGREDWDSRRLEQGDIFSAVPLRPGTYSLANRLAERSPATSVTVSYPDPRQVSSDSARARPRYLHYDRQGFSQGAVELQPGQGLVITVREAARFTLTLTRPDHGPADLASWREEQRALLMRTLRSKRPT